MIAVRLMGGLGNQMFQYAAAKSLALGRKSKLLIDLSFLMQRIEGNTHRQYELHAFNLKESFLDNKELRAFEKKNNGNLFLRMMNYFSRVDVKTIFRETTFGFQEEMLVQPDNTLLIGNWQSEKYFSLYQTEIRKMFTFPTLESSSSRTMSEKIRSSNAVSLHIRRGDYVSNPVTKAFHATCSMDYYQHAVEFLEERIGKLTLFVFSDDMDWVMNNFKVDSEIIFVSVPENKNYDDMHLMSMCRHHIIANSSFSWWAAWINPAPGKIVVAPLQWFNDTSIDTKDLIPADWFRL